MYWKSKTENTSKTLSCICFVNAFIAVSLLQQQAGDNKTKCLFLPEINLKIKIVYILGVKMSLFFCKLSTSFLRQARLR